MSPVTRKPVFGVCDHVRLKPVCSATEASWSLEISDIETRDIILSRQRTTKVLICTFVVRIWQKQVFSWRGSNAGACSWKLTKSYCLTTVLREMAYGIIFSLLPRWYHTFSWLTGTIPDGHLYIFWICCSFQTMLKMYLGKALSLLDVPLEKLMAYGTTWGQKQL